MNLDFADYTITIAIVPVDLRAGYSRLSAIALTLMKIDVDQGNDVVIFISNVKSRSSWGITAPTIPYLNFVSALRTASGES